MEDEATEENTVSPSASDVGDTLNSKDNASSCSSAPRERCQYGASCYRRNEEHKKQFSHPGDPDYDEVEVTVEPDAAADNRPECKYGTHCYRQNPQHKKDFKHTSVPVVPVKKKRKKKVEKVGSVGSDQESRDDYDYDDPFLNDDSSDDYQPTSSDSESSSADDEEMEDDTKRTLREGKKFAKR